MEVYDEGAGPYLAMWAYCCVHGLVAHGYVENVTLDDTTGEFDYDYRTYVHDRECRAFGNMHEPPPPPPELLSEIVVPAAAAM